MSQSLQFTGRIPRGWFDLAHALSDAAARRRPEFAQTEPALFRSECFVEDLDLPPSPMRHGALPVAQSRRWAALLCAAPVCAALLGTALIVLDRVA